MRRISGALMAAAEWVVGLLVLLYIVWGMCCDCVRAKHKRLSLGSERQRAPGGKRRGSRRVAAALTPRQADRFPWN